jgi:hypothetical protein
VDDVGLLIETRANREVINRRDQSFTEFSIYVTDTNDNIVRKTALTRAFP